MMQCNIKVSRLPKGIFIIQETEGALIAPKKYDTINYQDYVLY